MFDEINRLILETPALLEHLRIFFYVRLWALTLLAAFFVYLIVRDHRERATQPERRKPVYRFYA